MRTPGNSVCRDLPPSISSKVTAEIASDPQSKTYQFIARAFGPPLLKSGAELDALVASEIDSNQKMLEKLGN